MSLEEQYKALEKEFIKYCDLKYITIEESNENFISLSKLNHSNIKIKYENN